MVKVPTPGEEDRRHLCRERKALTAERVRHVNRIKGFLFSQGVSGYQPLRRDRRQRLEELQTGDGRAFPQRLKALVNRELDRLELLLKQIKIVEAARDELLAVEQTAKLAPAAMLLDIRGIGLEFAAILWSEGYSETLKTDGRSQRMRVWLRHPGRAARSIENRECPKPATRDCEQQ
jgi:transposase